MGHFCHVASQSGFQDFVDFFEIGDQVSADVFLECVLHDEANIHEVSTVMRSAVNGSISEKH